MVATLGPASSAPEMIERLFRAGADVFRLNFSHGSHADHAGRIGAIRALEGKVGRPIGILADVQGPKLRVGRFGGGRVQLQAGQPFRLDLNPTPRIGAYATALGQPIMAWLPPHEQVAQLEGVERVKLFERTLTDLDALLARLAEVRARGYAVSDGENAYGLVAVAAPVLDARGAPCAGVSLTVGGGRMSTAEFTALAAQQAKRLAAELSECMRLPLGAIGVHGARP